MNTGQCPKSYNNPDEWEKIEQADLKKKNQKNKYKIIDTQSDIEDLESANIDDSVMIETIDAETVEPDEYETLSDSSDNFDDGRRADRLIDISSDTHLVEPGEYDDVLKTTGSEGTSYEIMSDSSDSFDDVLQLTEYDGGGLVSKESTDFVVAEYDKIDVVNIDKEKSLVAKRFVSKITKFVLEFNDVQLTEDHKSYIKQVGNLQLSNLQDLLTLVEVNKQMIGNIVARVNAVQAEDYAIVNSYNNLVNQHIKLIKEVSNLYKSIPNVMKKMRADVLSNQELEQTQETNELITEDYGSKQFNNSKQMLKQILEKRKQKSNEEDTNK